MRSPMDRFGDLEFVAWYLPENEGSSIHKDHPFKKEVHAQLYGLGIMNKFKEQDKDSLYQRMYMAPGFTHDLFYDSDDEYVWHQYEAVTNSIWFAVCEY